MSAAVRLTDDEVAERLAAVAPPLDAKQRATLASLWRQTTPPCRPDPRSTKEQAR